MKRCFASYLFGLLLFFNLPVTVFAQETLNLNDLIDEALEKSPYVEVFEMNKDAL